MTGHIAIGGRPVSEMGNSELVAWFNETLAAGGYKRLRAKTAGVWVAVMRAFDASGVPMTSRGVFYRLESAGVVPKTENAVDLVQSHVLSMRQRGILPYGWIADSTRRARKPATYNGLSEFLDISKSTYRRALWAAQSDYVEVWCEKDTLAGIMYDVTEEYDVPLMVTRGQPSETFVYEAAETIKAVGKPAYIYYFGDYDYYGQLIPEGIRRKLWGFGAYVNLEVVAIQRRHIEELNLPTRPPKGSRRSLEFGESVELDALPVDILRGMVRDCIERHIDRRELAEVQRAEELERGALATVASKLGLAGN